MNMHRLWQLACLLSLGALAVAGSLASCRSELRATPPPDVKSDVAYVAFTLVEQESGLPLGGVALEFEPQRVLAEDLDRELQGKLIPEHATRTTDEHGEAHFEVRMQREYSLHGTLCAAPFTDFYFTFGPFKFGVREELRVAIPVHSDRVVRGRVVSIADHTPIAGAMLRIFADTTVRPGFDSPMVRRFGESVTTDANGQYTLRVSTAFPARVSIVAAGHAEAAP